VILRISSSLFPENIGPQTTSIHPAPPRRYMGRQRSQSPESRVHSQKSIVNSPASFRSAGASPGPNWHVEGHPYVLWQRVADWRLSTGDSRGLETWPVAASLQARSPLVIGSFEPRRSRLVTRPVHLDGPRRPIAGSLNGGPGVILDRSRLAHRTTWVPRVPSRRSTQNSTTDHRSAFLRRLENSPT